MPADVLSPALYVRFRSRQEHPFSEKVLSAMWDKFGGHVERRGRWAEKLTVAEIVGVEDRGNYYDTAGVLRDMAQNHMFQLLIRPVGGELGKVLAQRSLPELESVAEPALSHDSSTNAVIRRYKRATSR